MEKRVMILWANWNKYIIPILDNASKCFLDIKYRTNDIMSAGTQYIIRNISENESIFGAFFIYSVL